MREVTVKLYQFDELPTERAKDRARQWYREASAGDNYFAESIVEDFETALEAAGFSVSRARGRRSEPAIYWELNPDSAGFDASWSASRVNVDALIADRPVTYTDSEGKQQTCEGNARLVPILERLRELAKAYPESFGSVGSGRDGTSTADVEFEFEPADDIVRGDELRREFEDICRDLAHYLARCISQEWDYTNSDEYVDETIRINEYEFTENGERA